MKKRSLRRALICCAILLSATVIPAATTTLVPPPSTGVPRSSDVLPPRPRSLDLLKDLQGLPDRDMTARQTTIERVERVTHHQTAALGYARDADPKIPAHEAPSDALLELAARHDADVSLEDRRDLRTLDALDDPLRSRLTRVIDAFLAFDAATQHGFGTVDAGTLRALADRRVGRDGGPSVPRDRVLDEGTDRGRLLADAGVDLTTVFSTRNALFASASALRSAVNASDPAPVEACSGPYCIDLGTGSDDYTEDRAFQLDAGGDDTYRNNAGGSGLQVRGSDCWTLSLSDVRAGAAALVDLAGEDAYGDPDDPGSCGVNGGGVLGSGFLYDAHGNDTYIAGDVGSNGGGDLGKGFLYDAHGHDTYTAGSLGTNGGGNLVSGLLYDGDGNDTYTARAYGTNGGSSIGGVGFVYDGAGDDRYEARKHGTNGGGDLGKGFLYDASGDDTYTARDATGNGGSPLTGSGLLHDGEGTDRFDDPTYTCDNRASADCSKLPKGRTGALVDHPPDPCRQSSIQGLSHRWTAPTDFDRAVDTFDPIHGVRRVKITNDGGSGFVHTHGGERTASLDLHEPGGRWVRIWHREIGTSWFEFHNLTVSFPLQDVDGIRLRVDQPVGSAYHDWGGMRFTFRRARCPL